ncbi:hypothetical protein GCM10009081_25070 [Brevundimonas nasdae]
MAKSAALTDAALNSEIAAMEEIKEITFVMIHTLIHLERTENHFSLHLYLRFNSIESTPI